MENKKINITNKLMIVAIVLLMILIMLIATYAWQTWSSQDDSNKVNLTVKNLIEVLFYDGVEINVDKLEPVLSYEQGAMTNFSMKKITSNDVDVDINLNLTSIEDELKDESLKYRLMYSSDNSNYQTIATGNFKNATDTLKIIDNYIVSTKMSYFKIYIYIDANLPNPGEMQEKLLQGIINISASKIE